MYDEKSRCNERGGIEEKLDNDHKYRKQNIKRKKKGKEKHTEKQESL